MSVPLLIGITILTLIVALVLIGIWVAVISLLVGTPVVLIGTIGLGHEDIAITLAGVGLGLLMGGCGLFGLHLALAATRLMKFLIAWVSYQLQPVLPHDFGLIPHTEQVPTWSRHTMNPV